jgi:hypothetical protein
MESRRSRIPTPRLGVIEGFYGPLWGWDDRSAVAERLARHGYGFWHYAPKADPAVRENWREDWPDDTARALRDFGIRLRGLDMAFGVGITPLGLRDDSPRADWRALAARLAQMDCIGIDELVLCFDDLRGDVPDLARQQTAIAEWAAARTDAARVIVCPTYYSDDLLLDRVFGTRPRGYLGELGRALDARIAIFWTGEEVCAREITAGSIRRIADTLRRPPLLWDNYPVNDSPRMRRHLHLRAFTGRDPGLADVIDGHAINPALQPHLSTLPALTLPQRYRLGDSYGYMAAFRGAAEEVLGVPLAGQVEADLGLLHDAGLDRIPEFAADLEARYRGHDHPTAREILHWLNGGYAAGSEAPSE